ncbi:hypothetical protein B0H13DRAFT_2373676 [Mycena leptocephala]|nr:hypothetical protein B0H13DRAFT_2373676 [Mycena leptocephala]
MRLATSHQECLTFARYHEHLRRHTSETFRMLMPRLIVTNCGNMEIEFDLEYMSDMRNLMDPAGN